MRREGLQHAPNLGDCMVGVVVSMCGELDVVVPVPVLPGRVSGCTVVLVDDIDDVGSRSLTGSLGCELGCRSACGVVSVPSEAILDTALAWFKLWAAFRAESVQCELAPPFRSVLLLSVGRVDMVEVCALVLFAEQVTGNE